MRNKKLYSLTMAVTVSLLLFTGCGDKGEPVTADSESQAYTNENGYPIDQTSGTGDTSGEIVEAEKPVEEGNGMIGEDTDMTGDEYHEQLEQAEEEANKADQNLNESTGIEIVEELDKTMYAQQNCNSRSGDGTNYDKVASIEKGAQLHVTGRTSNDWYRVEWGDGVVYIAGSLLGRV
ncbi:SH3 domain-containing protein [Lachnospiraceae bacterium MD335]|nr:SH3 domain-containing protein [Lachnospiraceae bacterium MD335]